MRKNNKVYFASLLLNLFLAVSGFAWGPTGHETVAYIAEDHLTPKAKEKVYAILGLQPGQDMASVATWADNVRMQPRYRKTAPWHYIDLDVRAEITKTQDLKPYENGNEVESQIHKDIRELKTSPDLSRQQEDLKFLIHFVGDIHCPVHCVDDQDKGGNLKQVRLFNSRGTGKGSVMKLHAVWDRLITSKGRENSRRLADSLEHNISDSEASDWTKASVEMWALESYSIAKNKIYTDFPNPGPTSFVVDLPRDYYGQMRPVAEEQLEKAGIRLANVLNSIFDPGK